MKQSLRITKCTLNAELLRVKKWLSSERKAGLRSKLIRGIPSIVRGKYTLDWKNAMNVLQNIEFIPANEFPQHWAETDGKKIWINPLKEWSREDLFYTLLHEALHGIVRRGTRGDVSELREHLMMSRIDPRLVDDPNNPSPWL